MQRLLFLSTISGLLLAAGCSDDACGPGDAPAFGISAANPDVTLTYGAFTSAVNNDCPDPAAPSGVISITLSGSQMGGGGLITLCMPRPDIMAGGVMLGTTMATGDKLRIVDLNGMANSCTFTIEQTRPVSGNASTRGLCDNGNDPAGYALLVDGNISLRRDCAGTVDTIAVNFSGSAAVSP